MARGGVVAKALTGVCVAALALGGSGCTIGDQPSESETSTTTTPPKGDGTLVLAAVVPSDGEGSAQAAAQRAAVTLAITQINAAGGFDGTPITQVDLDLIDPAAAAAALAAQNVDLVIGAGGTPEAVGALAATPTPVLWASPTPAHDNVHPFSPTTATLAAAATATALADGKVSPGVLVPNTDDGKAATTAITAALTGDATLATDAQAYDPGAGSVTVPVTKVKSGNPDAILVVGDPEPTGRIVTELNRQRLGPANLPLYLAGPNVTSYDTLPDGALTGTKGVRAGAPSTEEFTASLAGVDPAVAEADLRFAPEAYDATIVAALAALAAQDDDGPTVAEALAGVTDEGTACTSFAACAELIGQDEDIRYEGVSGALTRRDGLRVAGQAALVQYGDDNLPNATGSVTVG
ncbi:MAG: ABC transporter substrate-binding protein [Actinomycetales bacterium]